MGETAQGSGIYGRRIVKFKIQNSIFKINYKSVFLEVFVGSVTVPTG